MITQPCPWRTLDCFLAYAGAVEHRRREKQEYTHVIEECREHHGFHVIPRIAVERGAA